MEGKKEKKLKDYSNPTPWQLFWRIQRECFRRSVTIFLMYTFMSMLMFAVQAINREATTPIEIVLGCLCLAGGMFFNGHLCYHFGITHYDAYVSGCLYRKNLAYGIRAGGDHRPEREYRFWKGALIGLYAGLFVIIFGTLTGLLVKTESGAAANFFGNYLLIIFSLCAGWAIIPVGWMQASYFLSIAFAAIPLLVSLIFYNIGALKEKRDRAAEAIRQEKVEEAGRQARERVQTEEQRRKTLQSKKKK